MNRSKHLELEILPTSATLLVGSIVWHLLMFPTTWCSAFPDGPATPTEKSFEVHLRFSWNGGPLMLLLIVNYVGMELLDDIEQLPKFKTFEYRNLNAPAAATITKTHEQVRK